MSKLQSRLGCYIQVIILSSESHCHWSANVRPSKAETWQEVLREVCQGSQGLHLEGHIGISNSEGDIFSLSSVKLIAFQCVKTGTTTAVDIPLGQDMASVRQVIVKPDKHEAIIAHQSRFL